MILWFLAWDLEFGILGLEICSLGVWVWDSVLGFVVWFLGFGLFVFGKSSFGFSVLDFELGVWEFEFWSLRI